MVRRLLSPLKTRSYFLFGPRGAGKSTWLETTYPTGDVLLIDLLDLKTLDELYLNPERFEQWIMQPENLGKTVIVDEIQKLPKLLDTVHSHIVKHRRKFILTGSSARRLKQQGVNLLAGRASVYHLYPLTSLELGSSFNLTRALQVGGLPEAYLAPGEEEMREYLSAYVLTYLEKEVQQEQWVRKIEPFRKFLAIAAQMNGQIVNYSAIAKQVGVTDLTVRSYYEILVDTLMGIELPAFHESVRKAQRQSPKFYLIDTGIKRALEKTLRVPLLPQTFLYGQAFEHWMILEFYKNADYLRLDWQFSYLRTKDDVEIDLIITRPGEKRLLVEIKSKEKVSAADAKSLETLGEDVDSRAERLLISNDPLEQKFGKTRALHWKQALEELFKRLPPVKGIT